MVQVSRVYKQGGSLGVLIPKNVLTEFQLRRGDIVALRIIGEKLVMQRINVEQLAIIRTGEPEMRAE